MPKLPSLPSFFLHFFVLVDVLYFPPRQSQQPVVVAASVQCSSGGGAGRERRGRRSSERGVVVRWVVPCSISGGIRWLLILLRSFVRSFIRPSVLPLVRGAPFVSRARGGGAGSGGSCG
jgi:hypothetical protein